MLKDTVNNFHGQVETSSIFLQFLYDSQALIDMMKTSRQEFSKDTLTGMAEGRMAEVMTQGNRFGEVFVQAQGSSHSPGDLAYFKGMSQSGSVVVPFRREKNLRLILQATESFTIQNAISINLKNGSYRALIFRQPTTF
jgi:hypothetical protein